ncbi:LysR family transcriptional regulator [Mycobacterium shinjukuense]|uniref:Probable hydrogen peroxide-inducible genes activator n=1 Tax=Mycobacterium shinjukuense TaxID=398694 RepID=A0A7I7MQ29_9MYCO|nr:LysR family transcriptional regulator [Mycobacterium shinjukuense]MCV6985660.1 LysR family transcriptional regulator [Mycobacterium shinjukuense]ORB71550.1 LuxR family transcriptional regulator [Mycobacterium shinjukuense]BBX74354.1 transcriptional regulator [Mycobacterium shinjukuense]
MELYQLRYFQTVADVGTLRDAAERLAVSQSAVSRAIAMLESEIGVELFTRRGRANELNRFGLAFLRSARAVQRSLEAAVSDVRQLAGADAGTVALGFPSSLGVATVPRLIRRHHDRYPAARFELRQRVGAALVNDLVAGGIDICLTNPMTFDESANVQWHPLFIQPLYAVVDRAHPLARREVIGFEELAGQPIVALDRDHTVRRIFDDACHRYGISPTIAFEGTDITTLRGLIAARLGVGVLPKAAEPTPNIVEIAFDDQRLVRPIAIGWMANRYLPPSAAAFRDTVITSCGLPEQDVRGIAGSSTVA